ncbi:MAG: transglutaminase family protein [Nitrospira sp.]|nr:transglutaminase family protein [Nitrospira sp.]
MRLSISHLTKYEYDKPVHYALQQVRLTPKSQASQTALTWDMTVGGGRKELEFTDQHNNLVTLISLDEDQSEISIQCQGEVETIEQSGIAGQQYGDTPLWYFKRSTALTKPGAQIHDLVNSLAYDARDDLTRLHALSGLVAKALSYEKGRTNVQTTAEDALRSGYGVCQDHTHIFLSAVRLLGFPARYVSGYLMMDDRVEQDASHAWAEAWIDRMGWTGFDVSNGVSPDERYVRVATGLDYRDAAPISGIRIGDAKESMIVTVRVQR